MTFKILGLFIILFCLPTAWASRSYRLKIQFNTAVQEALVQFDKDHQFEVRIPLVGYGGEWLWSFSVTSPDLPPRLLSAAIEGTTVVAKLQYQDPLFVPLNFSELRLEELILLLANEEVETKQTIVRALAKKIRLDLFTAMLSELAPDEWQGIESSYLLGLMEMQENFGSPGVKKLIEAAVASQKFPHHQGRILLMGLGLAPVNEIYAMKALVAEDESLRRFLHELQEIAPRNQILTYLLAH